MTRKITASRLSFVFLSLALVIFFAIVSGGCGGSSNSSFNTPNNNQDNNPDNNDNPDNPPQPSVLD